MMKNEISHSRQYPSTSKHTTDDVHIIRIN